MTVVNVWQTQVHKKYAYTAQCIFTHKLSGKGQLLLIPSNTYLHSCFFSVSDCCLPRQSQSLSRCRHTSLTVTFEANAHLCTAIGLPLKRVAPACRGFSGMLRELCSNAPPEPFTLAASFYRRLELDGFALPDAAYRPLDPLRVVPHEGGPVNKDVFPCYCN